MAPKEETNENGNATDGMTTEEKMVDVSTKQEDIPSAGKHCNSIINHSEVPVTEVFDDVHDVTSSVENDAICRKIPKDVELDASKDEKEDYGTHIGNLTNKEENSDLKTLDLIGCDEVEKRDHDMMDESMCTKDNSVTMSLCVSVADGAVLPPDLWHAAVKKEPVNVWIVQVSDGDFSPDSKVSSPLQIVFPWEHSWSWDSQLDPASSDEDEPPTYTTLQTVNWDDTTSCHSGQLRDASHEGAGSSGFSDDEEMSSVTGENFNLLGSDSGLQTSSSDGDLRMLHQSGGVGIPEDSWSEDANTFALTELRLGSDADSRCSIDTDRQTEAPSSLPASGAREHFSCPLCQKTFTDQLNFKYHKRTHKDRKLFTCDLCNQKFAREKTLERHRLTHSVPVQPPVLECPACSETFEQRTQLRIHMRAVHRDEPTEVADGSGTRNSGPFTCEICRKTFAHATRLKHHQAAHYERQYNCHICSVTLATKHSLRRHLYIHSGEKPFGCDICGKAFAFELYLRNHMKKHLAFKFHNCAFCPEQFCSRRELKAHLQVHRGQYHCQVCKENFRSKHKLQEHMQSHET